mmetsp:Transcript_30268/g.97336  ORF Transcript_30268/g.97336 Transcript_30268/m.97336 type:complete len:346 (+) Transcript_30268:79-1116(+)
MWPCLHGDVSGGESGDSLARQFELVDSERRADVDHLHLLEEMVSDELPAALPLRHVSLLVPQDVHDRLEDASAELIGVERLSDIIDVDHADVLDRALGLHVEPAHVEVLQQHLLPLPQLRVCPIDPHLLPSDSLRHRAQDVGEAAERHERSLLVEVHLRLLQLLPSHQDVSDSSTALARHRHLLKRLEVLQTLPHHHRVREAAENAGDDVEAAAVGEGEASASELGQLLEQSLERGDAGDAHLTAKLNNLEGVAQGASYRLQDAHLLLAHAAGLGQDQPIGGSIILLVHERHNNGGPVEADSSRPGRLLAGWDARSLDDVAVSLLFLEQDPERVGAMLRDDLDGR